MKSKIVKYSTVIILTLVLTIVSGYIEKSVSVSLVDIAILFNVLLLAYK
jgi:hypothetical protein